MMATWEEVKESANRIMKNNNKKAFGNINDVIGEIYHNHLPGCLDKISRQLFIYPEKIHLSDTEDINNVINASKELDRYGYIKGE